MLLHMAEQTGIMPKALLNKPTIETGLQFAWSVFTELSRDRAVGFNGPEPIRFRDFLDFAKFHQFTREDAEETWEVVRLTDRIWLIETEKRQQAKTEKPSSGAKSKAGS